MHIVVEKVKDGQMVDVYGKYYVKALHVSIMSLPVLKKVGIDCMHNVVGCKATY